MLKKIFFGLFTNVYTNKEKSCVSSYKDAIRMYITAMNIKLRIDCNK